MRIILVIVEILIKIGVVIAVAVVEIVTTVEGNRIRYWWYCYSRIDYLHTNSRLIILQFTFRNKINEKYYVSHHFDLCIRPSVGHRHKQDLRRTQNESLDCSQELHTHH